MNFNEFQTNVIQWATERQIIQNSSAYMQTLKLISEYGELCDAIAKNDMAGLMDAIGDVSVCAVNFAAIHGVIASPDGHYSSFTKRSIGQDIAVRVVGELAVDLLRSEYRLHVEQNIGKLLAALKVLGLQFDLVYEECLLSAWNEIKDRKGHMNKNGVFIKDETL